MLFTFHTSWYSLCQKNFRNHRSRMYYLTMLLLMSACLAVLTATCQNAYPYALNI